MVKTNGVYLYIAIAFLIMGVIGTTYTIPTRIIGTMAISGFFCSMSQLEKLKLNNKKQENNIMILKEAVSKTSIIISTLEKELKEYKKDLKFPKTECGIVILDGLSIVTLILGLTFDISLLSDSGFANICTIFSMAYVFLGIHINEKSISYANKSRELYRLELSLLLYSDLADTYYVDKEQTNEQT